MKTDEFLLRLMKVNEDEDIYLSITELALVRDVFRLARGLVHQNGWCQHTYARTATGEAIDATLEEAVKFSLLGSIQKAALDVAWAQKFQIEARTLYRWSLEYLFLKTNFHIKNFDWNDNLIRTQSDVVDLLDKLYKGENIKKDSVFLWLIRLPLVIKRLFLRIMNNYYEV